MLSKLVCIARTRAASADLSAQRFGSAVGGAGGFVQSRGSPAVAGGGGHDASPVLLAQNFPPASVRAQIVALPLVSVTEHLNVLNFPACAAPRPWQTVAVICEGGLWLSVGICGTDPWIFAAIALGVV